MPGIRPIREKFLERNYLFATEFFEGWLFGRVVRRRICQYKPYPLIDENGSTVDIAASGYQSEIILRDPRNVANKVIYLPTTTNAGYPWIMHGSIGVKPQYIRVYVRFPAGADLAGKWPNLDPIRPKDGNAIGYISEKESPYDEPTDWVELVVPPLLDVGFEFYNTDDRAHQPVLNLLFAIYWFKLLDPDKYADARLIGKIARREVPAAFFTIGFADRPIELGNTLTKDWKAKPLSLDEASELGR